jgi:hypothetical protein
MPTSAFTWSRPDAAMFDTYAEIFEKRASEYHFAMKQWPGARAAEFEWRWRR